MQGIVKFENINGINSQAKKEKEVPIPEPIGVVAAAIYLIFLFISIPIPFYDLINRRTFFTGVDGLLDFEWFFFYDLNLKFCVLSENSAYLNLMAMLAGIVSICTAVLLGFADDILDLRWRHKLIFPTLSSLPLLLVYLLSSYNDFDPINSFFSENPTAILMPKFVQNFLGASYLDIGPI